MLPRWGAITLILVLSSLDWPATRRASAQQYDTLKPTISAKAAKVLRSKVLQALRNPSALAANRGAIDDYFKKYLFRTMTDTSPDGLGQLSKLRDDLFKRYLRSATSKPAQDHITDLTRKAMSLFALGRYHPAVRYNAVLILGELDKQYATKTAPPTPLPAATNVLLILLEKDEIKKIKIPPMLKVGALVGLERHARFGIDPQYQSRVTQGAIQLIEQQETPAEMSPEVHHWLKCMAGRVLVRQFASSGPDEAVNKALVSMIGDQKMSLEDRCSTVALLKEMDYSAAQGLDRATTVAALGNLAQAVTSDEADHARDFKEELLRGNAGQFQRGSYRATRGLDTGPHYRRRRLLDRLLALTQGIDAVSAGANAEVKGQLQGLTDAMRPVIATASEKDTTDVDIADPVIELASSVSQVVRGWKSPDQPAKDEAKAEEDFS